MKRPLINRHNIGGWLMVMIFAPLLIIGFAKLGWELGGSIGFVIFSLVGIGIVLAAFMDLTHTIRKIRGE